ncbi:hypothetical protein JNJ66_00945 [Candidatus Saccharibacteria bacterium]|nr:hypothetical protein [Candidatus Saccharibacteria bacterium]
MTTPTAVRLSSGAARGSMATVVIEATGPDYPWPADGLTEPRPLYLMMMQPDWLTWHEHFTALLSACGAHAPQHALSGPFVFGFSATGNRLVAVIRDVTLSGEAPDKAKQQEYVALTTELLESTGHYQVEPAS